MTISLAADDRWLHVAKRDVTEGGADKSSYHVARRRRDAHRATVKHTND